MITTSCRLAITPATANFHSKRKPRYTMMPMTTTSSAIRPLCSSSWPTCGPTNSTRRSSTPESAAFSAAMTVSLWVAEVWPSCRGRRIMTSCEVPKFCTWKSV
ncbi:hypothetical protein FQZ97_1045270 [compost metagenome]